MNAPRTLPEAIAQIEQLRRNIDFIRAAMQLTVLTANGPISIQWTPGMKNATIDLRTITPTGATPANVLPSQTGNANKALSTDGTNLFWA